MDAEFINYRNQHMVIPPLDEFSYPQGYDNSRNTPQCVFSKWAQNLKSSANKGAVAIHTIGAVASIGGALLNIGMGGSVVPGVSSAGNSASKAVSAANLGTGAAQGVAATTISKIEYSYWNDYWLLMNFEPAVGYIGEQYIGISDNRGCVGHWFYDNGDYFEGYHSKDNIRTGIFIFTNGVRFWGSIFNNVKVGESCIEIFPDGSRIYGNYEKGNLVHGLYECEECALWGSWVDGKLNGTGIARYANNTSFVGDWSYGTPMQ